MPTVDPIKKKVNIAGIPESMMNFQNWLVRVGKVPYSVKDGKYFQADPTDMNNFLYFEDAVKALETHNELSGIGFAFDGGSFVGIDIDHCVVDGKLNQLAKDILKLCKDTYVEFSVSGNGIHIIYWDTDTKGFTGRKNSNLGLEIYANKHYFAITGNRVPNTSDNFNHFQGLTKKLLAKYFSNDSTSLDSNKQNEIIEKHSKKPTYSDDELLNIIKRYNDSKFDRLFYDGDISEYADDDSSADMALMMKLAFYTDGNAIQMESLFNQSALGQRDKWNNRQDYRQRTIANALKYWIENRNNVCNSEKSTTLKANFEGMDTLNVEEIKQALEKTKKGKPLTNTRNFKFIFNHDPIIKGCIGYNKFAHKLTLMKPMTWTDEYVKNTAWSDADYDNLQAYIDETYDIDNTQVFLRMVNIYAHDNTFHPIRDFFKNLPEWDRIPRAETIFIDALKINDCKYAREISKKWLIAAVARVFNPACKFDYCLVIKGAQGIGKSTVFKKLGGEWFNDSINTFDTKDAMQEIQGSWIVELGEMQAARKSENEMIKSFISRQNDNFRPPYGRTPIDHPRQCVFCGTTNEEEFLKDMTGGRRFLVLVSNATSKDSEERLKKLTPEYINQVWAEIFTMYKELFKNEFDDTLLDISLNAKEYANTLQKQFTEGSEFESEIITYLEKPIPRKEIWRNMNKWERRAFIRGESVSIIIQNNNIDKHIIAEGETLRDRICAAEIAFEAMGIDSTANARGNIQKINRVLAQLPDWQHTTKEVVKIDNEYGTQRHVFEKIK